jgi:hypothetical protein
VGRAVNATATAILAFLEEVQRERERRAGDAVLAAQVEAIKHWQQERLRRTYADLQVTDRYRAATTFFMDELYGTSDFGPRDAQFARVVPAIVRLFPTEVAQTMVTLSELHALSERFDSQMGAAAGTPEITEAVYARTWRAVGQPAQRERQIALLLDVGNALDRHTRSRVLRTSLHMMRRPARAAGLSALQAFLEAGFDAFGAMGGAEEFLGCIAERERRLAAELFLEPPR